MSFWFVKPPDRAPWERGYPWDRVVHAVTHPGCRNPLVIQDELFEPGVLRAAAGSSVIFHHAAAPGGIYRPGCRYGSEGLEVARGIWTLEGWWRYQPGDIFLMKLDADLCNMLSRDCKEMFEKEPPRYGEENNLLTDHLRLGTVVDRSARWRGIGAHCLCDISHSSFHFAIHFQGCPFACPGGGVYSQG